MSLIKFISDLEKVMSTTKAVPDKIKESSSALKSTKNTASASTTATKATPLSVKLSGSVPVIEYQLASDCYFTFGQNGKDIKVEMSCHLPVCFKGFNSHSENDFCFLYMYDDADDVDLNLNKPHLCVTTKFNDYIKEYAKTGSIKNALYFRSPSNASMLFNTKLAYRDYIVYMYAYKRAYDGLYSALAMFYRPDILETDLERKLNDILDYAASTFQEKIVG